MTVSRDSVPTDRKWGAESVFATPAEWEAELEVVLGALPALAAFQGRLGEGSGVLTEALLARDRISRRVGRLTTYADMGYAVETTNDEAVARYGRATALGAQVGAATAFVDPEVLSIGREPLAAWTAAEPALAPYEHYFDDLFRLEAHTRSSEVEEVLGLASDAFSGPYVAYSALVDSDLVFRPAIAADGEPFEVTQGTIDEIHSSPDRALRRSGWESYADGHIGVQNALAATLGSAVKQAVFSTRVRRHGSTLSASLTASNLPIEVFDSLLAVFETNLPTWHRYWELRRRVLGVERLAPWDATAPLGATSPVFTYEQSVEWICGSLAPLGHAYVETVRRGCLDERWVDVYPTAGKMGNAFSAGSPGTPPFIMMNFDGTAVSLGTLAHELGHSMHSYLTWQAQPQPYTYYSMFVAEVASNFHQALLRAYLLDTVTDPVIQLAVLDEAMANFQRYFFIMPTLARVEREVHERVGRNEGVTAAWLGERTADLFAEGFGPDVEIDRARLGITWAQFSHLYAPFYVFQYATGISAAHALAGGVIAGEHGAADNYLAFLSAGASLYPLDALRLAGVNMTGPEPVEAAFAVLSSLVDRIAALA
ncbi:oligoendopeptidase F [Gaiella sp.]|uniref:oligoendopeptidase F n=1 Tax=Gaiella sp. TaxID=2663207 RepID=UPI003266616C